jgi:hypothetical protein
MNSKSLSRQDEDSMRKVNYKTKKARTYKEWSPKFKHQSGQLLKIITKLSQIKKNETPFIHTWHIPLQIHLISSCLGS